MQSFLGLSGGSAARDSIHLSQPALEIGLDADCKAKAGEAMISAIVDSARSAASAPTGTHADHHQRKARQIDNRSEQDDVKDWVRIAGEVIVKPFDHNPFLSLPMWQVRDLHRLNPLPVRSKCERHHL